MSTNADFNIHELLQQAMRSGPPAPNYDRYFLVDVQSVAQSKKNRDAFRVVGTKVETGERVAVFAKKSSSGQNLPEPGGMFRADKAKMLKPDPSKPDIALYEAEYFHAYPAGDACLKVIGSPQPSEFKDGFWSGKVNMIDVERGGKTITALDMASPDALARQLLPFLKPWEHEQGNSTSHDLKGASIWQQPMRGACPFAMIRLGDGCARVFGKHPVKGADGTLSWPSDEELLQHLRTGLSRNNYLQRAFNALAPLAKENPELLQSQKLTLMPGVSVNVGLASLSNGTEKYLPTPDMFRYANENRTKPDDPEVRAGWREAYVHLKADGDKLFVVNMVPVSGSTMTKGVPLSAAEQAQMDQAQTQTAQAGQQAAPDPQNPPPQDPAPQAQQQAPQSQQRVQNQVQQPAPHPVEDYTPEEPDMVDDGLGADYSDDYAASMGDFESYASDLAAMEAMNADPAQSNEQEFEDDGFDDLIAQAEEKVKNRYAPRM